MRTLSTAVAFIAVAALLFAIVGPRILDGSNPATGGAPIVGSGPSISIAPSDPSVSVQPSVAATRSNPAPSLSAGALPSVVSASGIVDCGRRTSSAACAKAVALARAGHEIEVAGATRIVVDDTCPPTVMCDRKYPFDSVVVFVTAGGDTTGWYAFHVVGLEYDAPTKADPWEGELPAHLVKWLREPQSTP